MWTLFHPSGAVSAREVAEHGSTHPFLSPPILPDWTASHRKPRRSLGVLGLLEKGEDSGGVEGQHPSPAVALIPRARARLRGSREPEERQPQPFGVHSRNAGGLRPCSPIAESGFGGLSPQLSFSHLGEGGLNVL